MLRDRRVRPLCFLGIALLLCAAAPATAQDTLRHDESASDHYEHGFDNPERYAKDWNDPERAEWQKPDAVIDAMGVARGMTVADLGTGTGYFLSPLAEAVGPTGQVRAVDVEPAMLNYVAEMTEKKGLSNVDTVHAAPAHTRLDSGSVDRILTVNTWHHIPNRGAYAAHLADRLKDGGTVWVIDFTREAPMGPPRKHRLDPRRVVEELEQGGFEAEVRDLGLPHQYAVVGRLD